jgi:carbon-monoxide dehydrogenase medium subunit
LEGTVRNFRQFIKAQTEAEALSLKKTVGAKALYVAGGTGVVPFAGRGVEVLIDLTHLGLDGISLDNGLVTIGATTRLADLLSPEVSAAVPALYDAVRKCATPLIRNAATIGGSLAGIFLPSDPAVALLALGADLHLEGDRKRTVAIEDLLAAGWLNGYEIIRKVAVRRPGPGVGACFTKFGRSDIDIALVNTAVLVRTDKAGGVKGLRVAVGQTSSMPAFFGEMAEQVKGRNLSSKLVEMLAVAVSEQVKLKSDYRASGDYRKHLIKTLVARSIRCAAEEAGCRFEN